jgi:hypothetical protein
MRLFILINLIANRRYLFAGLKVVDMDSSGDMM